jgi:hypothetical protein
LAGSGIGTTFSMVHRGPPFSAGGGITGGGSPGFSFFSPTPLRFQAASSSSSRGSTFRKQANEQYSPMGCAGRLSHGGGKLPRIT